MEILKTINVPVQVAQDVEGAELMVVTDPFTKATSSTYVKYMDIEFKPYGFFNKDDRKNDMIEYDWTGGNLFWCIVFSESIVIPVAIIGLNWYEPVGLKPEFRADNAVIVIPETPPLQ